MAGQEQTFHFPHIRIGRYPSQALTDAGQGVDVFGALAAEGSARSEWVDRRIHQSPASRRTWAATVVRLHADGSVYAP